MELLAHGAQAALSSSFTPFSTMLWLKLCLCVAPWVTSLLCILESVTDWALSFQLLFPSHTEYGFVSLCICWGSSQMFLKSVPLISFISTSIPGNLLLAEHLSVVWKELIFNLEIAIVDKAPKNIRVPQKSNPHPANFPEDTGFIFSFQVLPSVYLGRNCLLTEIKRKGKGVFNLPSISYVGRGYTSSFL